MVFHQTGSEVDRQPAFNVPRVVILVLLLLATIHAVRVWVLSDSQAEWVVWNFAFFPDRPDLLLGIDLLAGASAWSYVTYSLLHADWVHLGLNALWMLAFGSPLAWRFGALRFLAFCVVAVVAGALLHMLANAGDQVPMVGASAAVSAQMAGAARFLFLSPRGGGVRSYWGTAASLRDVFSHPRTLIFIGAWFAINLAVGLMSWAGPDFGRIAWEAHIGGFAAGLLLFPLFDRVRTEQIDDDRPPAA